MKRQWEHHDHISESEDGSQAKRRRMGALLDDPIRSEKDVLHARSLRSYRRMQEQVNTRAESESTREDNDGGILGDEIVDESTGALKHIIGEQLEGDAADGTRRYEEGVMIEPFNLVSEREEGEFRDGFYVPDDLKSRDRVEMEEYKRRKQEQERQWDDVSQRQRQRKVGEEDKEEEDEVDDQGRRVHDAWVEQLDQTEFIAMARMSDRQRQAMADRRKREEEREKKREQEMQTITPIELKKSIALILHEEETVRDALERLRKGAERDKKAKRTESVHAKQFDILNDCTCKLVNLGEYEIYDASYETLQKELDNYRERVTWMYKWDASQESPAYGPYDTATLRAWQGAGHFQGHDVRVKMVRDATTVEQADEDEDMFADEPVSRQQEVAPAEETFLPLHQVDLDKYK